MGRRAGLPGPGMPVAREIQLFHNGRRKVTVKVDFVSKMQNDTIVLTDRKTGADNDDYETELQMVSTAMINYTLAAEMKYYQKSPDEIKSELVF
jgi:hypothetical protein